MNSPLVLIVVYISLSHIHSVAIDGELTTTQRNVSALAGSRVLLPCGTTLTSPVAWSRVPVGYLGADMLYFGGQLLVDSNLYSVVESSTGRYDLSINSVQPADAGTYICAANNGYAGHEFSTAEVTVLLNSSMECSIDTRDGDEVVEGDAVTMTCSFQFSSNLLPTLTWKDSINSNVSSVLIVNVKDENARQITDLKSFIVIQAGIEDINQHTCTVTLYSSNNFTSDIVYNWTSPNFTVRYPVRNARISSAKTYKRGDMLTCVAEGNPPARYVWQHHGSGDVIPGPNVTLDTEGQHVYTCTASNSVRNFTRHTSVAMEIFVQFNGVSMTSLLVGISLATVIITLLVATLCVHLSRRHRTGVNRSAAEAISSAYMMTGRNVHERPGEVRIYEQLKPMTHANEARASA